MSYSVYLNGFEVYKLCLAITLHFKNGSYDIFKSKGSIKSNKDTFEARPDCNFYYKLAEEYKRGDLANLVMANVMAGNKHVTEFSHVTWKEWKAKIHGIDYIFESDCKKLQYLAASNEVALNDLCKTANGGLPIIIQLMNGGHISLETVCIIDKILDGGLMMRFDESIKDKFVWPNIRNQIVNYLPWLKVDVDSLKKILIKYK